MKIEEIIKESKSHYGLIEEITFGLTRRLQEWEYEVFNDETICIWLFNELFEKADCISYISRRAVGTFNSFWGEIAHQVIFRLKEQKEWEEERLEGEEVNKKLRLLEG